MIGKVIEIGKSTVVVELTLTDEQKRGIINYHVAFDMEGSTIIGEIASIEKTTAHISLLGEIKNSKFTPGISKKPYYMSVCRIIRNDELPIIVGNTNEKSVYIGRLSQYNGYQVYAKVNDLFSNHFAILGNTGSGKSHGMARLLQNVFSDTTYPKNANFFLFDAYGEYNDTFIFNDKNVSKVYTTKVEEFSDARTELLKIPLWLLDVDDIALLLNATKSTQLPIIEKALKLVGVFARNEEEIITYKNDIIAKALNELLYSGGTPSQIRDQIFAVLTSFNTKDLNLDAKVVVPGWTRPLRQCLIIDKDGKLQEMQLLGEFFNSFIKEDLKLELPDGTFPFTLEHLNQAFDFALISEGVLKSDKVYDDNHVLKVRLESLMNGSYKEYFNIDKYITKEQFIDSLVKSKDGEKKQIINFNISYVDDRFAKVLVKIISKLLFEYSLALDNRASFPIHILLEEAHRYVQNDNDINILGYNIFERITKEGRKYGVILGMISQRPSEISETAISQCTNFLVFRMQHPKDLNYIREMVPNITEEMVPKFKVLQPGNCVLKRDEAQLELLNESKLKQPVWNKLYKKDIIKGIHFEKGKYHEDVFWSFQAIGNARSVSIIDYIGYHYWQRGESIMGEKYSLKRLDAVEGKCNRQEYFRINFPELENRALVDLWFTCLYHGQAAFRELKKEEKAQALEFLNKVLCKYPITREKIKNLNITHCIWLLLAEISFSKTCKIRNLLKVGV